MHVAWLLVVHTIGITAAVSGWIAFAVANSSAKLLTKALYDFSGRLALMRAERNMWREAWKAKSSNAPRLPPELTKLVGNANAVSHDP